MSTEVDKPAGVSFKMPQSFKTAVDIELAKRRISLRAACVRGLAQLLNIPEPEGEPKGEAHA